MGGSSSKEDSYRQSSSIRSTSSTSCDYFQSPFPQDNQNYAPQEEAYPYPTYPQNTQNLAPQEAYPYPAYNQQPNNAPPPQNYGGPTHAPHRKFDRRYSRIADNYNSLEEVTEALARAGLESSNLIVGIDFTKSNEWTGAKSFNRRSLHHIGDDLNPYEQAISIIGKTLAVFDEDNLIPCYGFGDASTHDQDVFSFYPEEGRFCNGFEEVLSRYREIVPHIRLAGPTSFAPVIEMAMTIVEQSGGQYHVLVIIADGQVTRSVDTERGRLSPQEQKTVEAIVKASNLPLSIVLVGVGDGPWDMMREFDDNIPEGESADSVSIDIDMKMPLGGKGKEYLIETTKGSISVFVNGDQEKPALVTYPDVALNYMSCFQGLFFCPDAASLLLHNFCSYHIDAPGHETGAAVISSDVPVLNVDDLADQVAEVLDYFGLKEVFCLGVTAGAYILTLFATKYRERVQGLILVSPICRAPTWPEWFYTKLLLNLLYFYGMCSFMKERLLQRYFSKDLRCGNGTESDIIQGCRKLLDERQSLNVMRFLQAINERHDLSEGLKKLQCKTLIFVGECSPFHSESMHMNATMGKKVCALVEVQTCGSLVTEEHPYAMLIPIEFFLMGFGLFRQSTFLSSSSNGSSHSCMAPELLSLESIKIKLKPIKTRATK